MNALAHTRKWDQYFLGMAKYVAGISKDPSTKTGAVIVDSKRRVISTGYNGFARGVKDLDERYKDRDFKLATIIHCEVNAIVTAKESLDGCTLYTWPFCSCSNCSGVVIQTGVIRCVAPPLPKHLESRWGESVRISAIQFKEAGVQLDLVELSGEAGGWDIIGVSDDSSEKR